MTDQEMRELDAWLAEHVMGWVTRVGGWFDCYRPDIDAAVRVRRNEIPGQYSKWRPSRDLNLAVGEVVPKVLERLGTGSDFCLMYDTERSALHWTGEFADCDGRIRDRADPSPALAVCLAAKAAWEAGA